MKNIKNLLSQGLSLKEEAQKELKKKSQTLKELWDENKDDIFQQGKEVLDTGHTYVEQVYDTATGSAKNVYRDIIYSDGDLRKLNNHIESQGAHYRELNRDKSVSDTIFLGGETLVSLLSATAIPNEIINAYESAYPNLSQEISFQDKIRELDEDSSIGFISAVKGKLFEQKYIEYLNDGNLPDGYSAFLAESATQPGWDIAIEGKNGEIASVLQAKATDSVSYVKDALEKYPNIDVVTTDEVYSHLVMSGISDNLTNSAITNVELIDTLNDAVESSELTMDFSPPLLTLAFIAFTSYKDESLTLYEKAKHAGNRSGKTYLSYLIGGGIAAITNTWWLGVIGSVGSRLLSERGDKKFEVFKKLQDIEKSNQMIIDRMKFKPI
ncbi:hypothetical protein ACLHDG_07900 [Sulfurovum sp. CS9]|uniref:hypothetical protein n=1 Tax=Sulfurovum sp. CS9 TaxID=3391146 RepID=UPI0039EA99BA